MLNFAYAEALELQGKYSEVHPIYESFLRTLREQLEALESRQLPVAASSSSSSDSLEGQDNAGEAVTGVIVTHRSASSASSNMLANVIEHGPTKCPGDSSVQRKTSRWLCQFFARPKENGQCH